MTVQEQSNIESQIKIIQMVLEIYYRGEQTSETKDKIKYEEENLMILKSKYPESFI